MTYDTEETDTYSDDVQDTFTNSGSASTIKQLALTRFVSYNIF